MPPRILLCGDVFGRLKQLFKRVESVSKSAGPFDALLCVGQFFPEELDRLEEFNEYVGGLSKIPLPTYFIGDYGVGSFKFLSIASKNSADLGFKYDGLKVGDNLYWLRGGAKFTLNGLSIAYLSGKKSTVTQQFGTYTQDDVDALRALADDPVIVDIFLTAPKDGVPSTVFDPVGCDSVVTELVAEIKPRYHVAGSKGVFYAREPYTNVNAVHVTRFVGLASVGNKDKQKFMHAISPVPGCDMSSAEISLTPPGSTLSPYTLVKTSAKLNASPKESNDCMADSQYWRYDVSQKRHKTGQLNGDNICFKFTYSGSCLRGDKCNFSHDSNAREQFLRGMCLDVLMKGSCEKGAECSFKHCFEEGLKTNNQSRLTKLSENAETKRSKECWFCLSSPNVESHLIVAVGDNFYCALPKGPLVVDHVLLIPIEHIPNTIVTVKDCESELVRLCKGLRKYYTMIDKQPVLFEWASKRGSHANVQVVPIPSSKLGAVPRIFGVAADRMGFKFVTGKFNDPFEQREWLRTQFDRSKSFFYALLPDGTVLYHSVDDKETFPAQFGREVLAGLLNIPDRADWRNCQAIQEEESLMAEEFKKRVEDFMPANSETA